MTFIALIAIVSKNDEEKAIDVAKKAGAGGVTILDGRSIGLKEKKIFFGLTLEENVSALLFILPKRLSMAVLKALKNEIDFSSKNEFNIAFSLPISHVIGLDIEEIHKFEKEIEQTIQRI
ncbi:MAG: transcriptional regulator [Sulfurimonas sp.]|jgi:hypothetical protein